MPRPIFGISRHASNAGPGKARSPRHVAAPAVRWVKRQLKLPESTSSCTPFAWELCPKVASKFAVVDNYTAHYLVAGEGPTAVVLIASQVVLARSYRSTVNALAREHTVYCIELPGCGRSDSVRKPFDQQQYAEWIVKFLEHLNISSAVIIGHSCSAAPAITLAASHPKYVSHLILVSAIGRHAAECEPPATTFIQ